VAFMGPYATRALAEAACTPPCDDEPCYDGVGGPLAGHPGVTIDGTNAEYPGTYPLVWGGAYWSGTFSAEGNDYEWRLSCAAGVFTLELWKGGTIRDTSTATAQACDPSFALVFDGTLYNGTGDITVELTA